MIAEIAVLLLLLLLAVVLGIRSVLRTRCLGKCAGCPYAKACAKRRPEKADGKKQP